MYKTSGSQHWYLWYLWYTLTCTRFRVILMCCLFGSRGLVIAHSDLLIASSTAFIQSRSELESAGPSAAVLVTGKCLKSLVLQVRPEQQARTTVLQVIAGLWHSNRTPAIAPVGVTQLCSAPLSPKLTIRNKDQLYWGHYLLLYEFAPFPFSESKLEIIVLVCCQWFLVSNNVYPGGIRSSKMSK